MTFIKKIGNGILWLVKGVLKLVLYLLKAILWILEILLSICGFILKFFLIFFHAGMQRDY